MKMCEICEKNRFYLAKEYLFWLLKREQLFNLGCEFFKIFKKFCKLRNVVQPYFVA